MKTLAKKILGAGIILASTITGCSEEQITGTYKKHNIVEGETTIKIDSNSYNANHLSEIVLNELKVGCHYNFTLQKTLIGDYISEVRK